jgi:hypothetical protein
MCGWTRILTLQYEAKLLRQPCKGALVTGLDFFLFNSRALTTCSRVKKSFGVSFLAPSSVDISSSTATAFAANLPHIHFLTTPELVFSVL